MVKRLVVFIDYQNTYHAAREAFHEPRDDPSRFGQVRPLELGRYINNLQGDDRKLEEVRIYRGLPSNERDRQGYAASQRQVDEWRRQDRVTVISRPLRYPRNYPEEKAEEKGIDVALAVDYVIMAVRGEYDVGFIMSLDTDLRPALEVVGSIEGQTAEVAAFSPEGQRRRQRRRLHVPDLDIWCHWIPRAAYDRMSDDHDYNRPVGR
jgi:uncharacterized LabA/DUF88 family protein